MTAASIAKSLKRTRWSVYDKASYMGIVSEKRSEAAKSRWRNPSYRRKITNEVKELYKKELHPRLLKPNLELSEDLFYLAGAIWGDGTLWRGNEKRDEYFIRLYAGTGNIGKNFATSFLLSMRRIGLNPCVYGRLTKMHSTLWCVRTYSKKLFEWYTSLTTEFLEEIFRKNKKYLMVFIRGLYEAEGYIGKDGRNNSYRIEMGMTEKTDNGVIRIIYQLLRELGHNVHLYEDKKGKFAKNKRHRLMIFGVDAIKRFLADVNPCVKNPSQFSSYKSKPWTKEELNILKEMYPNTPNRKLARAFGRTYSSIKTKGSRLRLYKSSKSAT